VRWWLGVPFDPVFPTLPLGTLSANLAGGYLVGVAVAFFAEHADLPSEMRLFVVTGFMGGLTTFSTFSAEAVTLISRSEYVWALAHTAVHLGRSLIMTTLGMLTVSQLKANDHGDSPPRIMKQRFAMIVSLTPALPKGEGNEETLRVVHTSRGAA
jgi:CrcB protein